MSSNSATRQENMGIGKYSNFNTLARWGSQLKLPELGFSEGSVFTPQGRKVITLAKENAQNRALGSQATGGTAWTGIINPNSTSFGQSMYDVGTKVNDSLQRSKVGAISDAPTTTTTTQPTPDIVAGDNYQTGQSSAQTAQANYDQKLFELQRQQKEADFQKALEAKNQGKIDYTNKFNTAQQRQNELNQYATDQYNASVARAGDQKSQLAKQYGQARGDLQGQIGNTQNTLTSAYSARGLGDSSFANKARSEADQAFQRNLSKLNEDEASQAKQIDDYLGDLSKQREMQLKQINWQDFDTAEQYQNAIKQLDSDIQDINSKRDYFRQQVDLYNQSLAATQSTGSANTANSMINFSNDITGIYKSALPNATKKQLMQNVVLQAGSKNPERDADAYLQYLNYADQISNAPNQETAMKTFDDQLSQKFNGWRPFGTNQ